ncbi:hypothetical protein QBC39DRAFT_229781, partial [Podospora conica]
RVLSFPYLDFINSFSIFRNSYRILIRFYITLARLLTIERTKPRSIFLIIFKYYR